MIEEFQITKTEFEHTVSPIIISAKFNGQSNKNGQKLVSWVCHLHSERLSDYAIMCHLNGSSTYIALQTNTHLRPGPYSESKLQLTTFICVKLCQRPVISILGIQSVGSTIKDFNYQNHLSVEKWQKIKYVCMFLNINWHGLKYLDNLAQRLSSFSAEIYHHVYLWS